MPETLCSHTAPVARKGSPAPFCSLTSHHCHGHLVSGPRPVPAPAPASLHLTVPWSRRGTTAAQNAATPAWQVQVTAQHCVPPTSATFLPTRPGSYAVQNTRGVDPCITLPPPSSPQPHPQKDRHSLSSNASTKEWLVLKLHPATPGKLGSWAPQPVAPGCFLPWGHWQAVQAAGMERERGGGSCCCPGFPRIKYEQPCCVILNC